MSNLETEPTPQALPQEWMEELQGMHPKSFEYQQTLETLQSLATEAGLGGSVIDLRDPSPMSETFEAPAGYESAEFIENGSSLDMGQFDGIIFSFAGKEQNQEVDVLQLKTDTGKSVRLCDLRPLMTSNVRDNGPKNEAVNRLLDKDVFMDVKRHVEQGRGGKNVESVDRVRYSTRKGTKVRAYWMPVTDNNAPNTLTLARLADCESVSSQTALYRRVFHKNM